MRGELEKHRRSDVKVTVETLDGFGGLEKSKYSAAGRIDFAIDLENTSEDRAVSIHAIYFYRQRNGTSTKTTKGAHQRTPTSTFHPVDLNEDIFCNPHFRSCRKVHGHS